MSINGFEVRVRQKATIGVQLLLQVQKMSQGFVILELPGMVNGENLEKFLELKIKSRPVFFQKYHGFRNEKERFFSKIKVISSEHLHFQKKSDEIEHEHIRKFPERPGTDAEIRGKVFYDT